MPRRDPEDLRAVARKAVRRFRARHRDRLLVERRPRDRARYARLRAQITSAKRARYKQDAAYAEKVRANNRAWYARNKAQRREYRRRYRLEHGDRLRARERSAARRKYAENPRVVLDAYKRWRLQNLERARAYVRVSLHRRRAAGQGTHFTLEEWLALLLSYAGRCGYCGSMSQIEADHRVPLCRGGSNTIENIIPACITCNRRKNRKTEDEFRLLLAREMLIATLLTRSAVMDSAAARDLAAQ